MREIVRMSNFKYYLVSILFTAIQAPGQTRVMLAGVRYVTWDLRMQAERARENISLEL